MMNIDNINNCISFKTINPFRFKFAYFDLKDNYLADKIFFDNKLTVIFGREYHKDNEKYVALVSFLQNAPISPNSEGVSATKQLDILLKNGKLLAKSSFSFAFLINVLCLFL